MNAFALLVTLSPWARPTSRRPRAVRNVRPDGGPRHGVRDVRDD
ncbi:hypothetical protein QJS66_16840 [Kocuria rhizophila]|nr:hypothetical protein QJS66_16840 [Kocuria rhizophila]